MEAPNAAGQSLELLELGGFLDPDWCEKIRTELRLASGQAATVFGGRRDGAVEPLVRSATRLALSGATSDAITRRLVSRQREIERHFGLALTTCETPQFLRYQRGDFFVPHQDGNTPLIFDDSRFRKVSVVVFLSAASAEPAPDTYGGGAFVVHGPLGEPSRRVALTPLPGTLIAFRAETTHEVTPVTCGERYTIVSWFR